MTTQLIRRLSIITALSGLLVVASFNAAEAAPQLRLRARAQAARASLGRGIQNTRAWAKSDRGKRFLKGAALVGGGMLLGATLANPVGAGIVAAKVGTMALAGASALLKGTVALMATKITVGHAVVGGVAVAKGVQIKNRAKANGTSFGSELKRDAKNGFGLFNLFRRGNKAPAASVEVVE